MLKKRIQCLCTRGQSLQEVMEVCMEAQTVVNMEMIEARVKSRMKMIVNREQRPKECVAHPDVEAEVRSQEEGEVDGEVEEEVVGAGPVVEAMVVIMGVEVEEMEMGVIQEMGLEVATKQVLAEMEADRAAIMHMSMPTRRVAQMMLQVRKDGNTGLAQTQTTRKAKARKLNISWEEIAKQMTLCMALIVRIWLRCNTLVPLKIL